MTNQNKEDDGVRLIDADTFDVISWSAKGQTAEYERGYDDGVSFVLSKIDQAPTIDAIPIELTAQRLGRSFFSEPEKWADWLRMIRDDIPEEQDAQEAEWKGGGARGKAQRQGFQRQDEDGDGVQGTPGKAAPQRGRAGRLRRMQGDPRSAHR